MIKSLEVKLRDRAPFSYFDIVVFIFSERHALVDNLGKIHENILDLLLFPTDFCLEILDALRNNLGLFHQCRGFLFPLSRLGDCRRNLVPFLPQLISFCLEMPPLSIELQYEFHLVQLVRQALFLRLSLTISGFSLTSFMSSKTGSRPRLSLSVKNQCPLRVC